MLQFKYIDRYFNPMTNPIEKFHYSYLYSGRNRLFWYFLDFLTNRLIFKLSLELTRDPVDLGLCITLRKSQNELAATIEAC